MKRVIFVIDNMKSIARFISMLMISFLMIQQGRAQERKSESITITKSKEEVSDSLKILMQQRRNNEKITVRDKDILGGEPNEVLDLLEPYEKDSSYSVKWYANALAFQIGKSHRDVSIRQRVVAHFVEGLSDPESLVWQNAAKYLLDFNSGDFTDSTKSAIKQIFAKGKPERMNYIIRVIGAADMRDEMNKLGELLIDESKYTQQSGMWWATTGWAARLARARMGSKADITRATELIETVPDNVSRVTVLLHHIAYIRQPQAIEALQRYLNSDERLPRVKETVPGSCYCQYALDLLSQIIEGFPIKSVGIGYSQSEIETARRWMKNRENWINSIRR